MVIPIIEAKKCTGCEDCVEVCPVDCFYEGEIMLVIHPDECIDCGICEPECPADAILPDSDGRAQDWLALNTEYSAIWPNINASGETPQDADDYQGVPNKFKQYFSPDPGHSL